MQLQEAVKLIYHLVKKKQTIYADLGCGDGLFTQALGQMLAPKSTLYAVDKDERALKHVSVTTGIELKKIALDFVNEQLPLKNLSGILMANSLH